MPLRYFIWVNSQSVFQLTWDLWHHFLCQNGEQVYWDNHNKCRKTEMPPFCPVGHLALCGSSLRFVSPAGGKNSTSEYNGGGEGRLFPPPGENTKGGVTLRYQIHLRFRLQSDKSKRLLGTESHSLPTQNSEEPKYWLLLVSWFTGKWNFRSKKLVV